MIRIIIIIFLVSGFFNTIITQNLEFKFNKEAIPEVPLSKGKIAPIPKVKRIQKQIGTFSSNGFLTSFEVKNIKKENLIDPTNNLKNEGENKITKGSFSVKATLNNSIDGAENNGQFTISSGTVDYSIPDSGYLWVQLNTSEDLPSSAYVTNLQYRLKIDDTGDESNFYCGDYTIWLSSEAHGSPNKYLDVYNKLGGRTDDGYDDDIDDDSDIYLNWRSTSSFNGEDPTQDWCVWIEDHYLDDEGELTYIEFIVEWEAFDLPNLIADYTPNGWDGPIVASSVSGTRTDGPDLYGGETTYIDFAFINRNADISETFYIYLYDNEANTFIHGWHWDGIQQNHYGYVTDYSSTITAGTHTLEIIVDASEVVSESNENDNEFNKSFTWLESNSPDIRVTPSSITINGQSSILSKSPTLTKYDSTIFIPQIDNKYIVNSIIKPNGEELIIGKVPGKPPENYHAPLVIIPSSAIILPDLPAYDWSFGCAATSAAMIAGYYDRTGYPNMYTGPSNNGVAPMDNSSWGSVILNGETRKQCPISATRNGVDGRTTRGHVDDYWIKYGDAGPDPYINNGWTEHTYESCTGDFMKTSQSKYGQTDGGTHIIWYKKGSKYRDDNELSGGYGLQLFFESRGYNIIDRFTQLLYGYNGNTQGFTLAQFQQEIDAGRPVMIHIEGHVMVGVGYDVSTNNIYIHNTWDYATHSMTWGTSYSDKVHFAVTVYQLESVSNNMFTIINDGGAELRIDSIYNNKGWLKNSGHPPLPFNIPDGGNQVVTCSIDWDQLSEQEDGIVTIESNDPDENPVYVRVTAVPAGYYPALCVSTDFWDAPSAGGTSSSFSITNCGNNSSFSFSTSDNQPWLSVSVSVSSTPGYFTITAEPNDTDSTRSGVITVSADNSGVTNSPFEVLVSQDPALVPVESFIKQNTNALYQNYPNPFNPVTLISFSLVESQKVDIKLYNLMGEEVKSIVSGNYNSGYHEVELRVNDLTSGVYLYSLCTEKFNKVKKLIILK